MNNQIIKIQPIEQYFSLTWMLGAFCNYDCMYCAPEWHDTTSKPHSLDDLKSAWTNVYQKTKHLNLEYKISFTGGEVTANKSFLPFVTWLKETYPSVAKILITTNGSASVNYYTRLAQLVSAISFSTHSEFIDEKDFFEKAKIINNLMVRPEKSFHINIMDEFWNQDRIKLYKKFLEQFDISHSVNSIDYSFKTREVIFYKGVYNIEQTY